MDSINPASVSQVSVLDDFADAAARRFVDFCVGAIHRRGRIRVALTGGRTAEQLYRSLARPDILAPLDVSAMEFFQGDERPVGPNHPDSNWGMAESTFLDPAQVPQANRHRMRGEADDLDAAAGEYEHLLRDRLESEGGAPSFDLMLLGMGNDGHIASLFPGTAALSERERLVVANPVPEIGVTRLSVTYPVINAAQAVWIMVTGSQKAEVVRSALEERDPSLPVVGVSPEKGSLCWLLDRDAAGRLSQRTIEAARK